MERRRLADRRLPNRCLNRLNHRPHNFRMWTQPGSTSQYGLNLRLPESVRDLIDNSRGRNPDCLPVGRAEVISGERDPRFLEPFLALPYRRSRSREILPSATCGDGAVHIDRTLPRAWTQ